MSVKELIAEAANGTITAEGIVHLLETEGSEKAGLFSAADAVRKKYHGDSVKLRGIIEFSNFCDNNCHYCGLRHDNTDVRRYRYTAEEIIEAAGKSITLGYGTVVLQAGEDSFYDGDLLGHIIGRIKTLADVAITVSFGILPEEDYRKIRAAGADRYLMKHETSNAELFASLRPGTTLAERLDNLRLLKSLGFWIGSGMMIGLPGTTACDYARDIMLLKDLQVEMAGIGPFIPHHATPLRDESAGNVELTIKAVAVARLMLPAVHLPATTALGTLDKDARRRVLMSGANVIMPNVSPKSNRNKYEIYPNKAGSTDDADASHEMMMKIIDTAGRIPALFEK